MPVLVSPISLHREGEEGRQPCRPGEVLTQDTPCWDAECLSLRRDTKSPSDLDSQPGI